MSDILSMPNCDKPDTNVLDFSSPTRRKADSITNIDEIFRKHFNDCWIELQDSDTQDIKKLKATGIAKQQIIDLIKQSKPERIFTSDLHGSELGSYYNKGIREFESNIMKALGVE